MNEKQYYDDFYKKYGDSTYHSADRFLKIAGLCKGKVLDVACGTGSLSDYYQGDYAGIDISDEAISIAKKLRRDTACFIACPISELDLHVKGKCDTVVMGEFLEHYPDDALIFEMVCRVVKDDGLIICSVPNGSRVPDEDHVRTFTVATIRRDYSKYGKVRFYNWPGEAQRIIFTIELNHFVDDELTLVAIVKDEEKGVEKMISSCLEIVDKVVISVDSETLDKTAEIAGMYADELKTHKWDGDFSAARNSAQKNVQTKWFLFLDGHEYLESYADIKSQLQTSADGIMVTIRLETGMTFMFPRIYRSHIKFTGKVHNLNECPVKTFCPAFTIVHDRINLQSEESTRRRLAQRDEMLPRVMKERLKTDKNNLRALFHLGNYNMMHREWKQAIPYFKRYLKYGISNEEMYLTALNLGMCQQSLGRNLRAFFAFNKADALLPGRWETALLHGSNYMAIQFYRKALDWFVRALEKNKKAYIFNPFQRDGTMLWDYIATCFIRLQKYPEASQSLEQAIKYTTNKERVDYLKTKLSFVSKLL